MLNTEMDKHASTRQFLTILQYTSTVANHTMKSSTTESGTVPNSTRILEHTVANHTMKASTVHDSTLYSRTWQYYEIKACDRAVSCPPGRKLYFAKENTQHHFTQPPVAAAINPSFTWKTHQATTKWWYKGQTSFEMLWSCMIYTNTLVCSKVSFLASYFLH